MPVTTIRPAPPAGAPPRRGRRERERRASTASWGSWLLAVALIALVVVAGWWVTHSAIFEARTITVAGNRRLTDQQVLRLGGVGSRTNVLWFSPSEVATRLESSPWIGAARVSRTLPGTIAITVTEPSALAVLDSGTARYLLAPDGTVLASAPRRTSLPLIRIEGIRARVGERVPRAGEYLGIIAALPADLRSEVARLEADSEGALVLVVDGGIRVLYGDGSQAVSKGEALAAILAWAGRAGERLASIDVRIPVTPVASPMASEPAPSLSPAISPSPPPPAAATPTAR